MNIGKLAVFARITGRMDWLGDRQRVLAQNIANANTPSYVPKDLAEPSFGSHLRSARPLRMATTDLSHSLGGGHGSTREERVRSPSAMTISGNSVDLESELRKVSETGVKYQTMINLYQKHIALLKTAIGRSGA